MSKELWSFIEMENGRASETGRKMVSEAVGKAGLFGLDACGIVFCDRSLLEREETDGLSGLKRVYLFPGNLLHSPEAAALALGAAAHSRGPEFILFAHNVLQADMAVRLGSTMARGCVTNCSDLEVFDGKAAARKPLYGGKADALVGWSTPPPRIATLAPGSLEIVKHPSADLEIVPVETEKGCDSKVSLLREWAVDLSSLDLGEARVVVGVGKGVEVDFMPAVKRLAEHLGAAIGGTRISVFSGTVPHSRLIGTTGKWLDCDLYVALGISGAPQHVMGIKDARTVIAVNISRNAPIFRYATVGIVSDLHGVVDSLLKSLETGRGGAA
jgi:electron transfer flavoprotein alpha subunit